MSEKVGAYNPHDPSNKPGYDQLPGDLGCRECPAFNKFLGRPGAKSIRVECEWPYDVDKPLIVPDSTAPRGGGWLSDGKCRSGKLSR
jgi:hypothetical protein